MYELSDEDEKQIAIYCARATSKYNLTQQQGVFNLKKSEESTDDTDTSSDDTSSEDTSATDTDVADTGASDTLDTDYTDTDAVDTDATDTSQSQDGTSLTDGSGASLSNAPGLGHALGVPQLKFSFVRAKDVTNYSFDGYFDLSPAVGNHFLVLEYQVFNSTNEDIDLNVPDMGISFRATLDGASNTSDRTILLNDISSFNGTIKARKKQDMVMLFQFDPQYLNDLSNIQLQVISGEEKTLVEMR